MSITKSKNGFADYPDIPRTGSHKLVRTPRIPLLVITHDIGTRKFVTSNATPCKLFAPPKGEAPSSLRTTVSNVVKAKPTQKWLKIRCF